MDRNTSTAQGATAGDSIGITRTRNGLRLSNGFVAVLRLLSPSEELPLSDGPFDGCRLVGPHPITDTDFGVVRGTRKPIPAGIEDRCPARDTPLMIGD